ncbi:DtxR family Mn-dependent transcriptional regulator [Halorubrum trapanicum]|uniref:DtxR family Mn-dependent transcriptional regulator n=1 Tax=Halorubrum trapanicum TaxID=29284 RepID=A0A8J7UQ48_9EURY|nr:metal-dependent transcriptional regulator [Halorubrum trapanicum]MBP1902093.1 DtxR family Mn-dependent transcriptional regulator [Halorubrum trapanicum]
MNRTGRYLLAIHALTRRGTSPIRTKAVAEELDRSQAAVTEKFKRLDDAGLVAYEPYRGVTLTEAGRSRAVTTRRVYAIVLWFYRSVLKIDSCEAEAMKVAEALGPSAANRLTEVVPSGVYSTVSIEDVPLAVPRDETLEGV